MKRIFVFSMCFFAMATLSLEAAATATVVQVQGRVSIRSGASGPWVTARSGMTLPEGASITTGYQSAVTLRIAPTGSVVRLNQFTTVSVASLGQSGNTVNTTLKLKMGTVRAVVRNTVNERSSFVVSTPVATASVRGTIPEISHFPDSGTRIAYIEGSGYVSNKKGRLQLLARNQRSTVSTKGTTSTALQEAGKRRATAAIQLNLTPAEQEALFRPGRGRSGDPGMGGRDFIRDLQKWRYIRENLSDPVML
ncbi:MAG TPA: FecR family protein [Spirochaetota bacterium]|nr:FecR family protein [Spirochaetota bacterium]HPN83608.1 FecR family protein [Spirochaetota bacterium]